MPVIFLELIDVVNGAVPVAAENAFKRVYSPRDDAIVE